VEFPFCFPGSGPIYIELPRRVHFLHPFPPPRLGPARKGRVRGKKASVARPWLARISHHGSGRAGLQPRRYKAFLIIPGSRAPRSPAVAGLRGARDIQRVGASISAGLKPRPSGSPVRAPKRGEKSGPSPRL
jgi:hypothetical protein